MMKKFIQKGVVSYNDTVMAYLSSFKSKKKLTADEMQTLVIDARQGDSRARERLITANVLMVVNIASHYQYQGLPMEDLISEGIYGLLKAIDKYDVTKGNVFAAYAYLLVRQSILEAVEKYGRMVSLPHNLMKDWNMMRAYIEAYEKEYEEKPSTEMIAAHIEKDYMTVRDILGATGHVENLDSPLYADDDESDPKSSAFADDVMADSYLEDESERQLLSDTMQRVLDDRELHIVRQRFGFDGEDRRLADLAAEMHLSCERIRQLDKGAVKKMRTAMLKMSKSTNADEAEVDLFVLVPCDVLVMACLPNEFCLCDLDPEGGK